MNYMHNKPHIILGVVIPIILILGFIHPKKMFDVNVGDTYFVIQRSHLAVLLSFFLWIFSSYLLWFNKTGF